MEDRLADTYAMSSPSLSVKMSVASAMMSPKARTYSVLGRENVDGEVRRQ